MIETETSVNLRMCFDEYFVEKFELELWERRKEQDKMNILLLVLIQME